jgi:hypothetical protein
MRQKRDKAGPMVEVTPLAELTFRILNLPPISRASHFVGPNSGPRLHAHRLVGSWRVADGDYVPLAQAFRLLDVDVIARAIMRGMAEIEREGDPLHWALPTFEELLPKLRKLVWQDLLSGMLLAEGIKGIRGARHRTVLSAELQRLTPDWELSRLIHSGHDQFIDVRIQRAPAETIKKAWREKPPTKALKDAMEHVAQQYPPGAHPPFDEVWSALKKLIPGVPRADARAALKDYAPQLLGRRGYRSTKSPTTT